MVTFSESFGAAIGAMLSELGGERVEWAADGGPPPEAEAAILLAGGAETEAIDWLAEHGGAARPVYLVGALPDHRVAAAAVRTGARDYFALPEDLEALRRTLERVAREAQGRTEADRFAAEERDGSGFGAIIGRSAALLQALDMARRVARHRDVTVLIGGETGTGKELLARAIHYHGPRAAEPFVEINCAAIPENLLESELFGHEKGAFTGAIATKPGLFELAHGGTLFLDELGTLPLDLQAKLLRALESRSIRRVGGQSLRSVDVRVIAATHVDLRVAVARREFREDLYYRLNVVAVVLPPLRDRDGDVELLAETFLARLATAYGLPVPALTPAARARLRGHAWPGNVRELRNVIERALVLSPAGTLELGDLGPPRPETEATGGPLPFPAELAQIVRAAAAGMLELTGGNKSEAARRLGISRPRLQRLLDGVTDFQGDA
ncbi:MAG TPA: sigma-54 dependent transcriptional regulator [Gemmatimonadales bacterium]|nr:sigma-54 dependent transcriptional regulator [Gemmatimonadales bacterium]